MLILIFLSVSSVILFLASILLLHTLSIKTSIAISCGVELSIME